MKKIIMVLALIASMVVVASEDVYQFKSTMYTYSLKSQRYISTSLNGELTVDTDAGSMTLDIYKKDTKENYMLDLTDAERPAKTFVSTNSITTIDTVAGITNIAITVTTNTVAGIDSSVFAIISGKKNVVGATYMSTFEGNGLKLNLAGQGSAKTLVEGCGPCGETTSCIKIKTLKGAYVGSYDCGCGNGQYYDYDFTCDLPDEKEVDVCPIYGTWQATLKTVDGEKFK